jgi:pyruvate/2-oxoglutarate dehydrogenase complex dihydrolipoamide dehydrogenase (E3) component
MLSILKVTRLPNRVFNTSNRSSLICPRFQIKMASTQHFDSIVIGSGQSGNPLAVDLAKKGKKTALIEKIYVGGCCVNVGCSPTKTMIASGRVAYLTSRAADYGVHVPRGKDGKISVDILKVRDRKRAIVNSFRSGNEKRLKDAGVEIFMGEASFKDPKTLLVKLNDGTETTVTGESIFLNTGERPAKPKLEGIESIPSELVLDSTSIQELDEIPSHLLVLGGGYIGLEFGQLFHRLGSAVTIIQRGSQLAPREDPEIAEALQRILIEEGLTINLKASAVKVTKSAGGALELTVRSTADGSEQAIVGSHILFAVGRVPNTDMLDLQAAGVRTDAKGYVVTNDYLETSTSGIWALGDVKGPPAFTHISYDDFRILQTNISSPAPAKSAKDRIVPYTMFTDPQLGHVGLHEKEAREKFPDRTIQTASMPMEWVARALETDESKGLMKAVVDADSKEILGFTCLGMEGGEIMSIVQVAMMGGLKYDALQNAVFAHPNLAESLNNLWYNLK